jgi:uncharacterized membrane protein
VRSLVRAVATASLGMVLAVTFVSLAISLAIRQPCAAGDWADGRQYRRLCYTDIVPLYGSEQLTGGRLPYLDSCTDAQGQCDEYPLLTMYAMRLSAWVGDSYAGFFHANAALLALCALAVSWMLHRLTGARALFFAVAPTLIVYAFVNWDLLAVALATAATLAYLRRRDTASGVLLGLGAAAKLFPALLVVPFALGRIRERRPEAAAGLAVWATVAFAAVNLPFAVAAPRSWSTFFAFNAERPVDWDSLWMLGCQLILDRSSCTWSTPVVNALSAVALVAFGWVLWTVKRMREPEFPRWTFAFPLLVVFLLTGKVYSPQFSLWLLPWFSLVLPNLWLFIAFSASDVAVFVTRFSWFGRLSAEGGDPAFAGFDGAPLGAFQLAVGLRAAVLVGCLVAWVLARQPTAESEPEEASLLPVR